MSVAKKILAEQNSEFISLMHVIRRIEEDGSSYKDAAAALLVLLAQAKAKGEPYPHWVTKDRMTGILPVPEENIQAVLQSVQCELNTLEEYEDEYHPDDPDDVIWRYGFRIKEIYPFLTRSGIDLAKISLDDAITTLAGLNPLRKGKLADSENKRQWYDILIRAIGKRDIRVAPKDAKDTTYPVERKLYRASVRTWCKLNHYAWPILDPDLPPAMAEPLPVDSEVASMERESEQLENEPAAAVPPTMAEPPPVDSEVASMERESEQLENEPATAVPPAMAEPLPVDSEATSMEHESEQLENEPAAAVPPATDPDSGSRLKIGRNDKATMNAWIAKRSLELHNEDPSLTKTAIAKRIMEELNKKGSRGERDGYLGQSAIYNGYRP